MAANVTSHQNRKRPTLDDLLVHPIRKVDNDPGGTAGSYPDWLLDHQQKARFYVGGFNAVRSITRRTDAKYYHSFVDEAIAIAKEEGWSDQAHAFRYPASYNQFRNVVSLFKPMFFEHAAQVILSCECAMADTISKHDSNLDRLDVYGMMKIIPATYHIEGLGSDALRKLRHIENFDSELASRIGQPNRDLLDDITGGHCVTRRTARAIRSAVLEILKPNPTLDTYVGDVRGQPGKKNLGRKSAASSEAVELDDLASQTD